MAVDCYCDYEIPSVFSKTERSAKKEHKCDECGRRIRAGERYENVFGVWDGDASTFKTCPNCVALREFVVAHVPCCCWLYGNMLEDCVNTARDYAHEAPGLMFGVYRRMVAIQRARRLTHH